MYNLASRIHVSTEVMYRRIVKKLITVCTLLPLRVGTRVSQVSHFLVLATPSRKCVLTIAFILGLAACALLIAGYPFAAASAAFPAFVLTLPPTAGMIRDVILLWRITPDWEVLNCLPTGKETLLRMGIGRNNVEGLISMSAVGEEVLVAEFDQNNSVVSMVGDIPMFSGSLISDEQFRLRSRNRIQLVAVNGMVCIKKSYKNVICFCSEALALDALKNIDGVPKIVAINWGRRVLYQSYLTGRDLGSMMVKNGVPIKLQHQVSLNYPGLGNWDSATNRHQEREEALYVLKNVISEDILNAIADIYEAIHISGVVVGDIKYGNVILVDGVPFLCDFDFSKVYRKNSIRFLREREKERDLVNFVFGFSLLTEPLFKSRLKTIAQDKEVSFYAPAYYGKGYSIGYCGSIEFGTGKWLFIKKFMPVLEGKKLLDLGCNNGIISLEMLRANAALVTGYELNPTALEFAKVNHKWFEFVDNRKYNFQVIRGPMHEICYRDLTSYDVACSFCSLYYEPLEKMEKITKCLSEQVSMFIVQCNENPQEHTGEMLTRCSLDFISKLLAANGFARQKIIQFSFYDRPLIIAHSQIAAGTSA